MIYSENITKEWNVENSNLEDINDIYTLREIDRLYISNTNKVSYFSVWVCVFWRSTNQTNEYLEYQFWHRLYLEVEDVYLWSIF